MNKRNLKSYFISVKNAVNKRIKLDNENENDGNQGAEVERNSKHSRKNVNSSAFIKWQKHFPWLDRNEKDLMNCNICKNFAKKEETSFIDGCPALRFETVSIVPSLSLSFSYIYI